MTFPLMQHSFLTGVISPELAARTDIEGYQNGAAELYNTFVNYKGGALNRAGTQWCFMGQTPNAGYTTDETEFVPRLIPFIYEDDQSLVMVFGQQGVYFIKEGFPILETSKSISAISKADPGVVTANAHGFVNNDIVFISGCTGMTEVNSRFCTINTHGVNTFNMYDLFTGANIDTTNYGTYTGGGTARRVYFVSSIDLGYLETDLWSVKFVQARDSVILVSPFYAPQILKRISNTNWTVTVITFESSTVAPAGITLDPSFTGSGTEYSYVVTATNEDTAVESEPSTVVDDDLSYWPTNADNIRVEWSAVTGAMFYSVYRAPVIPGRDTPANSLFGLIGQTKGLKFDDHQIGPNFQLTPPETRSPFTGTNNYPSVVTFAQQRLALGATNNNPFKVWCTPVGDFTSMNASIPPRDTDALELELASQRADPIKNLLAMPGGILAFTTEAVYHIYGGADGSPLTPNNLNADPVSYFGASNLAPIAIGYHILYTQNDGGLIRDLQYNFFAASYESTDITILAAHFFQNMKIMRWAYSNSPWKVVWAVRDDGRLLSLTYVPEQNVFAYAIHETQGFVKDVCVIPEGDEDVVYLAITRFYDGGLTPYNTKLNSYMVNIERMRSRVIDTIEDAWFLDAAITTGLTAGTEAIGISAATGEGVTVIDIEGNNVFTGSVVGKIIRAGGGMMEIVNKLSNNSVEVDILRPITDLYPDGVPRLQGPGEWYINSIITSWGNLWHLEGSEVWALVDGGVQGPQVIEDGRFTFDPPGSFAVMGWPFESRLKTLRLEVSTRELPTAQGARKTIPQVTMRFNKSRGVEWGQDYGSMESWPSRSEEPLGQPPDLISGDELIVIDGTWNEQGQVCARQTLPLPMEVLGIISEVELGDS